MSHHCEAALITCEDFRLHQRKDGRNYVRDFILGHKVDCDIITRGGGIQDLVRPKNGGFKECLMRDFNVSTQLHKCKQIFLINHQDCGAYSGARFSTKAEEIERHLMDLKKAKGILIEEFKGVEVITYYAFLVNGTSDHFYIEEV